MNVFVLSDNPQQAAKWHVDKHVVKMPLEASQLLCSVYWMQKIAAPYKMTHKNHPCAIFARQSCLNFNWVYEYGKALCAEYTTRYGKVHKSLAVLDWCYNNSHELIFNEYEMTKFPLAMPNEYKVQCPIQSYRNYYKLGKAHLHNWKLNRPDWID